MKILHTADWHLGKKVEGKSMLPNQRAALQDIEEIAAVEKPDLILVAGDVFDSACRSRKTVFRRVRAAFVLRLPGGRACR